MNYLQPTAGQHGLTTAPGPQEFSILRLKSGEHFTLQSGDTEMGIVLMSGEAMVEIGDYSYSLGPRGSVFADKPSALYIPNDATVAITTGADVELAICKVKALTSATAQLITPATINVRHVESEGSSRDVYDIFEAGKNSVALNVGETKHDSGWSSIYPDDNPNYFFEGEEMTEPEIYYFKFQPSTGFALQWLYSPSHTLDQPLAVRDGDIVATPYGHHPVAVAPKYRASYLWFY